MNALDTFLKMKELYEDCIADPRPSKIISNGCYKGLCLCLMNNTHPDNFYSMYHILLKYSPQTAYNTYWFPRPDVYQSDHTVAVCLQPRLDIINQIIKDLSV